MTTKIIVNLPVKDLPKPKDFFRKLGFKFNAQFTDETAAHVWEVFYLDRSAVKPQ